MQNQDSSFIEMITFGSWYWAVFIIFIISWSLLEYLMTESLKLKYALQLILGLGISISLLHILNEYGIEKNSFPIGLIFMLFLGLTIKLLIDLHKAKNTIDKYSNIVKDLNTNITKLTDISSSMDNEINKNKELISTIEQNVQNLKYSEGWHAKINSFASSTSLSKQIWQNIAIKYFNIQTQNIKKNEFVISLDFYPEITKDLFEYYQNKPTAKFEIISTMLPKHYFEFPRYENGKIVCRNVTFVDTYRESLASLISKLPKNSYFEFNRYTLLRKTSDIMQVDSGLYTVKEFCDTSDEKCIFDGCLTYKDYFIYKLHPKPDNAIIIQFDTLNEVPTYTNFIRIEYDEEVIFMVADIGITRDTVRLRIINLESDREAFNDVEASYRKILRTNGAVCK